MQFGRHFDRHLGFAPFWIFGNFCIFGFLAPKTYKWTYCKQYACSSRWNIGKNCDSSAVLAAILDFRHFWIYGKNGFFAYLHSWTPKTYEWICCKPYLQRYPDEILPKSWECRKQRANNNSRGWTNFVNSLVLNFQFNQITEYFLDNWMLITINITVLIFLKRNDWFLTSSNT